MSERLPLPVASAVLLADQIIVEAGSGKKTLVGVYSNIFAPRTPFWRHVNLYAELTDAFGTYDLDLTAHHLDGNAVVASTCLEAVEAADRLRPLELVVRLPVAFPGYGTYELRIAHEGRVFANRTVRVQPPPAGAEAPPASPDSAPPAPDEDPDAPDLPPPTE
ncbi:MAG: DUF6941 family protein [Planctomycetota bacterium]